MILDGVIIDEDNKFPLHSGGNSHVIFDIMRMLSNQEDREYILKFLLRQVPYYNTPEYSSKYTFAGVATGGAFLALMLAENMGADFLIIGKDKSLSNQPNTNHLVFIVDDVETTGSSLQEAREALIAVGVKEGNIRTVSFFKRPQPIQEK